MNWPQECPSRAVAWVVLLMAAGGVARAAEPPDEPMEKRVLANFESARLWSAAESTMAVSKSHMRAGQPVLHWHVAVDHFAGERNYPIGWPRISFTLREAAARDWSEWDYFQMWVFTDTTRASLPREPVGLAIQAPDKDGAYRRSLPELTKGSWVQIRIPLSELPRREDVRLIQLHVSESNYRHQDQLDFYIDELTLLRHARPTLLDFAVEAAVMFDDAARIPVRFNLAGVKAPAAVEVSCELRQGTKVIAATAVQAARGPQRAILNLKGTKLQPGDYEVVARVQEGMATVPLRVRVLQSPWPLAE